MKLMKPGATLRTTDSARSRNRHLYVVLSDPGQDSENVLIVNVTTYGPGKDDSCILNVGDHPFLAHKSCVRYLSARIASAAKIELALAEGLLEERQPVSCDVLARMRRGAARSPYLPHEHRRLLADQGLL